MSSPEMSEIGLRVEGNTFCHVLRIGSSVSHA